MIIITTAYSNYDIYKLYHVEFTSRCEGHLTLYCVFHQQLK